jgi:hypothetical protein
MKTPNLKRFALSIMALTVILAVPIVAAADDNHCGAKGTYAYTAFGNTFEGNPLGFPAGVASTNGTITLDGEGNWSVKEVEVVNGQVVNPSATFSGTYTLNSDCTFAAMLNGVPGPIFVGVVADHGKQIRGMSTIPGVQVNYTNTIRVNP